jgi:hypothetical protein
MKASIGGSMAESNDAEVTGRAKGAVAQGGISEMESRDSCRDASGNA